MTMNDAVASFPRRHAATRRFTLGAPRSFRGSPDGTTWLLLQSASATDPVNSLWRIRLGEDSPTLLVDATRLDDGSLTEAERTRRERTREQASGIVTYAVSTDFSRANFTLDGTLYEVAVDGGEPVVMSATHSIFDPRPQPGTRNVAYVSERHLRLTDGESDRSIPGTDESDETISWGSAEFVAGEEMGRTRGYWWSPDGGRIAATRVDIAEVDEWWIGSPDSPSVRPRPIRYPSAGTTNADVELWIVDPETGPSRMVDWRRGEFEYLANVDWGDRLICTVQARDHKTLAILEVDPDTGDTTELHRVTDSTWVDLVSGNPTAVGDRLAVVVDDGPARRLMLDGTAVTGDDVQIRQILGSHKGRVLTTIGNDPTTSVVAWVDESGTIEPMTGDDGWASGVLGGPSLVVSQARADSPTDWHIRWFDGSTTTLESHADGPRFPCTPTFHVLAPRELRTALCLPSAHDGSPLPVLLDPYGGPHVQRVIRARNGFAGSQWFAEQGFAVVVTDGRGTPGRGPEFERAVWGDLATPVLDDQVDALHALASERDDLDLSRVAIRGWSFGGFLAALAVLRRPDVFHAAVAGAPVIDWKLYDTHYTERYLGHPDDHPDHYERSSLLADAGLLTRPLMLIHGLADDNVVAAHTLRFSGALLAAGRPHEVLPLSGITHMTTQEDVAENLLHLQRDFLRTHLDMSTG